MKKTNWFMLAAAVVVASGVVLWNGSRPLPQVHTPSMQPVVQATSIEPKEVNLGVMILSKSQEEKGRTYILENFVVTKLVEVDGKWRSLIGVTNPIMMGGCACLFDDDPRTQSGNRIQGVFDHEEEADFGQGKVRLLVFRDCKMVK